MQDVDAYLVRRAVSLGCYFRPEVPAVLDDAHQVRLNYEAYFFSEPEMVARFRADPIRYCGLLTDPVSNRRFRPDRAAPRLAHEGVVYYFESVQTRDRFRRTPEAYVLPGWTM